MLKLIIGNKAYSSWSLRGGPLLSRKDGRGFHRQRPSPFGAAAFFVAPSPKLMFRGGGARETTC